MLQGGEALQIVWNRVCDFRGELIEKDLIEKDLIEKNELNWCVPVARLVFPVDIPPLITSAIRFH